MFPMKEITQIPVSSCPLCTETALSVVDAGKILFIKKTDSVEFSKCGAVCFLSQDATSVKYTTISSPYAHFNEYFNEWETLSDAAWLAEKIRTFSKDAVDYLPNEKKHLWKILLILGATGDADEQQLNLSYS